MLRLGQAFIDDEYASQYNTKSLYRAETTAQKSGLALWSEANLVMSWDFRSGSAPTPEQTQEPEMEGSARTIPPFQGSREITCSEILSREIALE